MLKDVVWVVSGLVFAGSLIGEAIRKRRSAADIRSEGESREASTAPDDLAYVGFALAVFIAVLVVRSWGHWDWTVPLVGFVGLAAARLSAFVGQSGRLGWLPWLFASLAAGALALS